MFKIFNEAASLPLQILAHLSFNDVIKYNFVFNFFRCSCICLLINLRSTHLSMQLWPILADTIFITFHNQLPFLSHFFVDVLSYELILLFHLFSGNIFSLSADFVILFTLLILVFYKMIKSPFKRFVFIY